MTTSKQTNPDGAASAGAEKSRHSGVLDEPLLPDDYPIYADYWYVADGKPVRSDWHGITARQFKGREGYTELRRCDIEGRIELRRRELERAGREAESPVRGQSDRLEEQS